jgi:magnesium transporter
VTAYLLDRDASPVPRVDRAAIESRLSGGEFFWLDLHEPSESEYELLRDVLAFHPLALEDTEHFGQRAKAEDYGEFVFIVFYGAAPPPDQDRLVEVHCFYSERYLVTVRKDEAPACEAVRQRYTTRTGPLPRPIVLLYRLLDELTDSFFPALADLDERIDVIQDAMLAGPSEEQLQEIFTLRRQLVFLRRAVTPQRDLVGQLVAGTLGLPGLDEDAEHYFRDVYDHLIRVSDLIDSYRDLLAGAMDVYLSAMSERLSLATNRLTILATVALPLIVITGFFGQNFGWLVSHIDGWPEFVLFGAVVPLFAVALLLYYLRRQRIL